MQEWAKRAKCAEFVVRAGVRATEMWDSGKPDNPLRDLALVICSECPVRQECADFAASFETYGHVWGIYGGMKERERNSLYATRKRNPTTCEVCGEVTNRRTTRLCESHYQKWRNYKRTRPNTTIEHFVKRTIRREKHDRQKKGEG